MNRVTQSRKYWIYLGLLLVFVLGCVLHFKRGSFGLEYSKSLSALGEEDAYISYRYGWNLAHFGVMAWNESGYRRVEGFTNPLWVYLSAIWALLGRKEWVYPSMAASSVILSATLLATLLYAIIKRNAGQVVAGIGLVMAVALPVTWLHSVSGLESGVFGAGLALLAYLVIYDPFRGHKSRICVFLLSVVLCWLRSDGFVYILIITFAGVIAGRKTWRWSGLGLLTGLISLVGWRWINFGGFLPNTAIAKVNFSLTERLPVGSLILGYVLAFSGLPFIMLTGLAGLWLERRRILLAVGFTILAWMGYYVIIGGDYLLERHLIGAFYLAGAASAPFWTRLKSPIRLMLVILLIGAAWLICMRGFNRFDYQISKGRDPWVMLGQEIAKNRDHYGVLIASAAGKIPFYAGGDCLDPFGLNDPDIAKIKRTSFYPGHSAGSMKAAIKLASQHPTGVYSIFSKLDQTMIESPDDIALWINTRDPQPQVQIQVTPADWAAAIATNNPSIWSIVSKPYNASDEP